MKSENLTIYQKSQPNKDMMKKKITLKRSETRK